jgi:hypothetical protein
MGKHSLVPLSELTYAANGFVDAKGDAVVEVEFGMGGSRGRYWAHSGFYAHT